jgi:hypothetical protein
MRTRELKHQNSSERVEVISNWGRETVPNPYQQGERDILFLHPTQFPSQLKGSDAD